MKAFILLFPLMAFAAIQTTVDPTAARVKLMEVLSEIQKNQQTCLKDGGAKESCEKKMQDELYVNGISRDWFEKGQKEYQEFWASRKLLKK